MSGDCWHEHTTPIESGPGVIVAQLCLECDQQMPASWGCPDCEWEWQQTHLLNGDWVLSFHNRRPCDAHLEG